MLALLRVQAHDLQNQGAAKNLKGTGALKRKVEADSHNVALKGTLREVLDKRETKRPNTAVDGGIDSADAPETGRSSICKYGGEYNTVTLFFSLETLPIQPEIGAEELMALAMLENELLQMGTPKIFGKFDLFDKNDPRYSNIYRSNTGTSSDSTIHPESLFKMIRTRSDNKFGTINIPQWYVKTQGSLNSPWLRNIDGPLEISIVNLLIVPSVELNDIQEGLPPSGKNSNPTIGPSVQGYLTLDALKLTGVKSALGTFKMKPVWREVTKGRKTRELFEGSLSFKLVYGDVLKRLGYKDLIQPEIGFWAIRAEV